jgi:MarR family 2-MHQ and catechol resistance regulon transcriptional repressor
MGGYAGTSQERLALHTYMGLVRAASGLGARLNRSLSAAGLTESQFGVLEALLHLGPLPQRGLAGKILRTHGNVTLVIDHLERRGLVQRQRAAADRRCIRVHLTEEGEALVRRLVPAHAARLAAEMSVLREDEQQELSRLCQCLLRPAAEP